MSLEPWPSLPFASWRDTCANLQLRTQIVGKIRLALTPWLNHSWHVTLYPAARGLTTGPIPYEGRSFKLDFDFIDHRLVAQAGDGQERSLPLKEQAIADFYASVMTMLGELGIRVRIHTMPNEVANPIPFEQDQQHRAYDAAAVGRFWRALSLISPVMREFRTAFLGKSSPVHFFWGSFDLAVTRFSGKLAPKHPGGVPGLPDAVTREAYSHEVCSAGFWPGGGGYDEAAFYCYAYPEPIGFKAATARPSGAFYSDALHEFLLPYEAVRAAPDPAAALLEFMESTYEAAATSAGWDRASLECAIGRAGVPRRLP